MVSRHCIVSPQFPGLVRNGGIGTHCFYLAKFLQKKGAQVTFLYTHPTADSGTSRLPSGLEFVWEKDLPEIPSMDSTYFLQTSARCHEWLKTRPFDFIHFQDWRADGFRCIQAKRTGQAFHGTVLTCMLNGSTLWVKQGAKLDPYSTREDVLLDYCESYAARHCDYLLSPSQYSLDWARENWRIRHPRAVVLPYLFEAPFQKKKKEAKVERLIFFGRLETRKGLELFLHALAELHRKHAKIREVVFIGRRMMLAEGDSVLHIENYFKVHLPGWRCRILENLDHDEALLAVRDTPRSLVVIPSFSETLCFTVLECIECGFDFIASKVGGIPELVEDGDRLFEPTVPALAAKLEEALTGRLSPPRSRWSAKGTEKKWSDFLERSYRETLDLAPASSSAEKPRPLVSVCLPHYNGAEFLEGALAALQRQTYPHFEVIVRDDASSDPAARDEFRRLARQFEHPAWTFAENNENHGPGYTRNRCAESARGDYLLFVDADNVSEPTMIERMVEGALAADLDATGCFMKIDRTDRPATPGDLAHTTWMPVGPSLPTLFFANLVGETNTLFRKSVFWKLGGFPEDSNYGNEDWELLIRLILQGHAFDIVPAFLFLYRMRPNSRVRTTPSIHNRLRAWRPLFEDLPPEKRFLATSLFIWEWRIEENNNGHVIELYRKLAKYESSWAYRLHQLVRRPRRLLAPWTISKAKR